MRRRRILLLPIALVVVFVVAGGAYLAIGEVIYDRLTKVAADCGGSDIGNTPSSFQTARLCSSTPPGTRAASSTS